MAKKSAGIVMYRRTDTGLEVLLVHSGGPYWANKDDGAWSIPKGEIEPGEDELSAARREFEEETGMVLGEPLVALGSVRHKSGKTVVAWAIEGTCDPACIRSNSFTMEWPPKSGVQCEFPEIDSAAFFSIERARQKILPSEEPFLDRLT